MVVAVIGDSYVWGMGVLEHQRLGRLLEQKLNKIRPTKVLNLGVPAFSTLEYLETYSLTRELIEPDIYIFVMVHNDALLHHDNKQLLSTDSNVTQSEKSTQLLLDCLQKHPGNELIFEPDYEKTELAWTNPTNVCVVDSAVSALPTHNTIYLLADDWFEGNAWTSYKDILSKHNKRTVSFKNSASLDVFSELWNDPARNFLRSTYENHPSAHAHEVYAEILFEEIKANKQLYLPKEE